MCSLADLDIPIIQLGQYIIIQRQKYTKLHKFSNLDSIAILGKEQIELQSILDQPYNSTFKMCSKETFNKGSHRGSNRLHSLQLCTQKELRDLRDILRISGSGEDNRNIMDDGGSQTLRPEEIEQLRDECSDSTKIIEKLVENSKTFSSKTEYSQQKYLKKKEKKYFEFVQIRKPSIRLLTEIFYRQDPDKVMGIRIDTLSKLISYSGVSAFGNYLLYESGTNGLLPAVFLNSMGSSTEAQLVHMHPGNVPQKQGILAMNFPLEQHQRCISVNIYSVLREFYQGDIMNEADTKIVAEIESSPSSPSTTEPISKKQKLIEESTIINGQSPQKWQIENRRAISVMKEKFDSLVIAAKEHPTNIVKALLPFLKPSRPIVIFSTIKETLTELYADLKTNEKVTNLHLTANWMRTYQILPNRTHPEVNMNGSSGYLLIGYSIS